MANNKTNSLLNTSFRSLHTRNSGTEFDAAVWEGPKQIGFLFIRVDYTCVMAVLLDPDDNMKPLKAAEGSSLIRECLKNSGEDGIDEIFEYEETKRVCGFGEHETEIDVNLLSHVIEHMGLDEEDEEDFVDDLQAIIDDLTEAYFTLEVAF